MSEELQKDFNSFLYIGEVLVKTGVIRELEKVLCHPSGSIYHVASDAEARAIVENQRVSAIIIDQYQPHCSGLDLMRWLQGLAAIPVIIVIRSSNFRDTDTVVALEAGATDAVQGDVSPRELAARIRAGIRKYFHGNAGAMDAGSTALSGSAAPGHRYPQYFNPDSGRVYFSDSSRSVLHGKEADLLNLLIGKQPSYIDREEISGELFQQSWNPNDRRIDNLVSRLRRMLDAGGTDASDSAIETVRNEGYRLRAPIALISMDKVQALALVRDECSKQ